MRCRGGGGSAFEVAESFFLVAGFVGEGLEAGSEVCDLGAERAGVVVRLGRRRRIPAIRWALMSRATR